AGGKDSAVAVLPATSWDLLKTTNSVPRKHVSHVPLNAFAVMTTLSSLSPRPVKSGALPGGRNMYSTNALVGSSLVETARRHDPATNLFGSSAVSMAINHRCDWGSNGILGSVMKGLLGSPKKV